MSSYSVSASAIFLGCGFKAEVFGDDSYSFLKVIETNKEQCEGEVESNEIYSFNDSSKKIKNGMIIKVQEQGACPMTPSGKSICSNWWTTNYTSYPTDIFNIQKVFCQSNADCSPYGQPSKTDCGGCEGDICSEYIPLNCYLYQNQVTCRNNTCISWGKMGECGKEGEQVSTMPFPSGYSDIGCCEGLTQISGGEDVAYCTYCGDGICKEPETEDNCPQDCRIQTQTDFGCSENSQVKICINTTFEKEINFIIKVKKTIRSKEDCCSPYFKIEKRVNNSDWQLLNVFKSHGKGCDAFIDEPIKEGCMCDPCWPYHEINPREFNFNWSKRYFDDAIITDADKGVYRITYQGFSKEFTINSHITDEKLNFWQKIINWFKGLFS